jgi:hypothetical protein
MDLKNSRKTLESRTRIAAYAVAVAISLLIPTQVILGAEKKSATPSPEVKFRKDTPGLSSGQYKKIKNRLTSSGISRPLPIKLTLALGATVGEEQLNIREISFDRDGFQHGFLQSSIFGDDRIIFLFRTPGNNWMAFLTNVSFNLISAAAWDAGELPKPLMIEEAKDAFDHELIYWATLSEIL